MKSILISIQPKWCELIASGAKSIEVRKTRPKIDTPFKCYIYCTLGKMQWHPGDIYSHKIFENGEFSHFEIGNGKIIGEFVCSDIDTYVYDCDGVEIDEDTLLKTMLEWEEINIYAKGKTLYGWRISDLKIYDKPKELAEFRKPEFKKCQLDNRQSCNDACPLIKVCTARFIMRPPQSWCYVEELE